MTRDDITQLFARRRDAFERLDAAALAGEYSDDCSVESPLAGGTAVGRDAIQKLYQAYFDAFPDFRFEEEELLIDGDRAAHLARISGTHSGMLMGMPPTKRRIMFRIAFLHTFRDGRIERERRVYDFTGVLLQVGLLKAKPA